jgi:hypothetical protein
LSEIISREDATRALLAPQHEDPDKKIALADASREAVELEGRRKFFWLRSKWSWAIMAWITILILFNCALAVFVGIGWLDFEKYQWFVTAVTVETFLQVIGLGFVAVRFLFSPGDSSPQ